MTVKVKSIRHDYDRRYTNHDLIVYVENTPLHKMADQWFNQNKLFQMRVKSKAWSMIIRYLNGVLEPKLASHFNVPKQRCKYSHKAGCGCGCSPGFRLKQVRTELQRRDAWVEVQVEPAELKGLKELMNSKRFQMKWQQDLDMDEQELSAGVS